MYNLDENEYRKYIHLIHIFFINIILIYVGSKKENSNKLIFYLLIVIAIFRDTIIYYTSISLINKKCQYKKNNNFKLAILYNKLVYILHLIFIVPLLLYVGIKKNISNKIFFNLILVIGITSNIYHIYRLLYPLKLIKC